MLVCVFLENEKSMNYAFTARTRKTETEKAIESAIKGIFSMCNRKNVKMLNHGDSIH